MDLFAHAHLKYLYKPGARTNPVTKHRRKRACTGEAGTMSVAQWVTMVSNILFSWIEDIVQLNSKL